MRLYGFLLLFFAVMTAPAVAQEIRLETCDKYLVTGLE